MIELQTASASLALVLLTALASGQTWTSPDGHIAITPPDASQFQALQPPPPPFVALWVSNDESMKFGIVTIEIPASAKLIQSSVEEGLAEEVGGKVTRLPTKNVSGHEVWCMSAKGPFAEITQAILRHDGTLYKVMAVSVGDMANGASVSRFIDSLSIAQHTAQPDVEPAQLLGGGADSSMLVHEISKKIGGLSCLLAIGLLVYFLATRKKQATTPPK